MWTNETPNNTASESKETSNGPFKNISTLLKDVDFSGFNVNKNEIIPYIKGHLNSVTGTGTKNNGKDKLKISDVTHLVDKIEIRNEREIVFLTTTEYDKHDEATWDRDKDWNPISLTAWEVLFKILFEDLNFNTQASLNVLREEITA